LHHKKSLRKTEGSEKKCEWEGGSHCTGHGPVAQEGGETNCTQGSLYKRGPEKGNRKREKFKRNGKGKKNLWWAVSGNFKQAGLQKLLRKGNGRSSKKKPTGKVTENVANSDQGNILLRPATLAVAGKLGKKV